MLKCLFADSVDNLRGGGGATSLDTVSHSFASFVKVRISKKILFTFKNFSLKFIIFSTLLSLLVFLAGCDNYVDEQNSPFIFGIMPVNAISIPTDATNLFTPKRVETIDVLSTNDVTARAIDGEFISDVLYATMPDGSYKEVLFQDSDGRQFRTTVSLVKDVGEGYLTADISTITEVTVENVDGVDKIIPSPTTLKIYKHVLIDRNLGKVYDATRLMSDYPLTSYSGIIVQKVIGNLIHVYGGSNNLSKGYYSIVRTTFKAYPRHNSVRDDLLFSDAPVFLKNGDIISPDGRQVSTMVPSGSFSATYDNATTYQSLKFPFINNNDNFNNYFFSDPLRFPQQGVQIYSNWLRSLKINVFDSFSGYYQGADGEVYTINFETHFDKPVDRQKIIDYAAEHPNSRPEDVVSAFSASCELNIKPDQSIEPVLNCAQRTDYMVLNRVYLHGKIIKRQEVTKIEDVRNKYLRDSLVKALDTHTFYDNESFYRVNLTDKTITKTAWKLGDVEQTNVNGIVAFSYNGIAWMTADQSSIYYIPYEADAEPQKIVDVPVTGTISLAGDILYYTKRTSLISFATYAKNVKTDEEKLISSSEMSIGRIIELKP